MFSTLLELLESYDIPGIPLDPRTKLIGVACFLIIFIRIAILIFTSTLENLSIQIQLFLRQRKQKKNITNIAELLDEHVNLDAKPIDDLFYFFDQNKDRSKQNQHRAPEYNRQISSMSEAKFEFKPRNMHLLQSILKEQQQTQQELNQMQFDSLSYRDPSNPQSQLSTQSCFDNRQFNIQRNHHNTFERQQYTQYPLPVPQFGFQDDIQQKVFQNISLGFTSMQELTNNSPTTTISTQQNPFPAGTQIYPAFMSKSMINNVAATAGNALPEMEIEDQQQLPTKVLNDSLLEADKNSDTSTIQHLNNSNNIPNNNEELNGEEEEEDDDEGQEEVKLDDENDDEEVEEKVVNISKIKQLKKSKETISLKNPKRQKLIEKQTKKKQTAKSIIRPTKLSKAPIRILNKKSQNIEYHIEDSDDNEDENQEQDDDDDDEEEEYILVRKSSKVIPMPSRKVKIAKIHQNQQKIKERQYLKATSKLSSSSSLTSPTRNNLKQNNRSTPIAQPQSDHETVIQKTNRYQLKWPQPEQQHQTTQNEATSNYQYQQPQQFIQQQPILQIVQTPVIASPAPTVELQLQQQQQQQLQQSQQQQQLQNQQQHQQEEQLQLQFRIQQQQSQQLEEQQLQQQQQQQYNQQQPQGIKLPETSIVPSSIAGFLPGPKRVGIQVPPQTHQRMGSLQQLLQLPQAQSESEQNQQQQVSRLSTQSANQMPQELRNFFTFSQFPHQQIEHNSQTSYKLFNEKSQQGYDAHVLNNSCLFLRPQIIPDSINEAANETENKNKALDQLEQDALPSAESQTTTVEKEVNTLTGEESKPPKALA